MFSPLKEKPLSQIGVGDYIIFTNIQNKFTVITFIMLLSAKTNVRIQK